MRLGLYTVGAGTLTVLALMGVRAWGRQLERVRPLGIGASPFSGHWTVARASTLTVPVTVGLLVVVAVPWLVPRARWAVLLVGAALGQVVWTAALAVPTGWVALKANQADPAFGYLPGVNQVGSPGAFLAHFTERISSYPTHVRGHPPGMVLLLWVLDRGGVRGPVGVLALLLLAGAATVIAVLVTARSLAGEQLARRAAPFVVFAPAALTATNLDLVYAATGAWSIALFVLATAPCPQQCNDSLATRTTRYSAGKPRLLAWAGGVMFGVTLLGTYGLALLIVPVIAISITRRRWPPLVRFATAAALVMALPAGWGYWWFDGLGATRHEYLRGLGGGRPGGPFAVFDLVAFATILGPVTMASLAMLRDRRLLPVVAGTGGAVTLALATQMSKGEVERIWQPFVPWLLLACGAAALRTDHTGSWRRTRVLLGAQVTAAVALTTFLRSPW